MRSINLCMPDDKSAAQKRKLFMQRQKCLYVFLAVMCFSGVLRAEENWLDSADTDWYAGGSPYVISNACALAGLAELVNEGTDFQGEIVQLAMNINLSGRQWTPIGTLGYSDSGDPIPQAFNGTFEGNGFVIDGLTITNSAAAAQGLFGVVANVRDVVLSNVDIRVVQSVQFAGGISGIAAAGLVGNCRVHGRIDFEYAPQSYDYPYVGGILGINAGDTLSCVSVLSNCASYVSIDSLGSASGGVAGGNEADASVVDCVNFGPLVCGGRIAGGVAGENDGTVKNCGNFGTVANSNATGRVGGVCGVNEDGASAVNSFNQGDVQADGSGTFRAGGVIGYNNSATAENCYSSGFLSKPSANTTGQAGGIVGRNSNGTVSSSYWLTDTVASGAGAGTLDATCEAFSSAPQLTLSRDRTLTGALNTWFLANNGTIPGLRSWLVSTNDSPYPILRGSLRVRGGIGANGGDDSDFFPVTVIFDPQGGSVVPTSKVVTNGLDYGTLPTPTRDATDVEFHFKGWYTGTRGRGNKIEPTTTVDSELAAQTLHAKWTKDNWIEYAATNWFKGTNICVSSSSTNIFYFGTPEELAGIALIVNAGITNFAGCTLILTNDISLAAYNRDWMAIGSLQLSEEDGEPYNIVEFDGVFDGDGHTVSGLRITESWVGAQGLFGVSGGTIQNLFMSNVVVELTEENLAGFDAVGSVAGVNFGTVQDCAAMLGQLILTTDSSEDSSLGGVIGHNGGEVLSCKNVALSATAEGNYASVGGVVGCNDTDGVVEYCINYGIVTSDEDAGGVVGENWRGEILSCLNMGEAVGNSAGGIAGENDQEGLVSVCRNNGRVTGRTVSDESPAFIGGIVGWNEATVSSCINESGACVTNGVDGQGSGGIVGANMMNGIVSKSVNYSAIYTEDNCGGIAGRNGISIDGHFDGPGQIVDCKNMGHVSTTEIGGGIVGLQETNSLIRSCSNYGTINASSTGGIVGFLNGGGTAKNCLNCGEVNAAYEGGGIAGCVIDGSLKNCNNTGTVSAYEGGGIAGCVIDGSLGICANVGAVSAMGTYFYYVDRNGRCSTVYSDEAFRVTRAYGGSIVGNWSGKHSYRCCWLVGTFDYGVGYPQPDTYPPPPIDPSTPAMEPFGGGATAAAASRALSSVSVLASTPTSYVLDAAVFGTTDLITALNASVNLEREADLSWWTLGDKGLAFTDTDPRVAVSFNADGGVFTNGSSTATALYVPGACYSVFPLATKDDETCAVWTNAVGIMQTTNSLVAGAQTLFANWDPMTATTPTPVPRAWIDKYFSVCVVDGDYERAAWTTNANHYSVWESYIAGFTNDTMSLKVTAFAVSNGVSRLVWAPDLAPYRVYTVQGTKTLDGSWGTTNADSRFFRVNVEMP